MYRLFNLKTHVIDVSGNSFFISEAGKFYTAGAYKPESYQKNNLNIDRGIVKENFVNKDWVFALLYLYKILDSLILLDLRKLDYKNFMKNSQNNLSADFTILNLFDVLHNYKRSIPVILFLDLKKKHNKTVFAESYILKHELEYVLQVKQRHNLLTNSFYTSSLNTGFFIKMPFLTQSVFKSTLADNLVFSKQQRWLGKNNILSDKIILKTNNWISIKKLMGNPVEDLYNNNYNIWLSNKSTSLVNFKKFNFLKFPGKLDKCWFSNSIYNKSPILNLENFETSLYWLTKRYSFLQNLSTNQLSISFLPLKKTCLISNFSSPSNLNIFYLNSFFLDYSFSQVGLSLDYMKFSSFSDNSEFLNKDIKSQVVLGGSDILSSGDSEFITYFSSYTTLNKFLFFF